MTLLLGAHMSVSGGLHRAVERVRSVEGTALQIFTRNQRQWKAAPLSPEEVRLWHAAWREWGPYPVTSHASYLINPANPDPEKRERSLQALADELARCALLDIPSVVLHPGSHLGRGVDAGLAQAARTMDLALERSAEAALRMRAHLEQESAKEQDRAKDSLANPVETTPRILLENTAGQGTNLGADFAELAAILEHSRLPERYGICLDTCHAFAAGYDVRTPQALDQTLDALDRAVGLERLAFLHLNDCKTNLGSRKDRHEHIGEGRIGESGFCAIMRSSRLRGLPMVLETDKDETLTQDVRNLDLLRRLYADPESAP
ncbi:MAG: deoxyribonuclease IV [Desulfovibrio sp.]|nr:deoxyribonuclease IV [Desulfovibrio sp.]